MGSQCERFSSGVRTHEQRWRTCNPQPLFALTGTHRLDRRWHKQRSDSHRRSPADNASVARQIYAVASRRIFYPGVPRPAVDSRPALDFQCAAGSCGFLWDHIPNKPPSGPRGRSESGNVYSSLLTFPRRYTTFHPHALSRIGM